MFFFLNLYLVFSIILLSVASVSHLNSQKTICIRKNTICVNMALESLENKNIQFVINVAYFTTNNQRSSVNKYYIVVVVFKNLTSSWLFSQYCILFERHLKINVIIISVRNKVL